MGRGRSSLLIQVLFVVGGMDESRPGRQIRTSSEVWQVAAASPLLRRRRSLLFAFYTATTVVTRTIDVIFLLGKSAKDLCKQASRFAAKVSSVWVYLPVCSVHMNVKYVHTWYHTLLTLSQERCSVEYRILLRHYT